MNVTFLARSAIGLGVATLSYVEGVLRFRDDPGLQGAIRSQFITIRLLAKAHQNIVNANMALQKDVVNMCLGLHYNYANK